MTEYLRLKKSNCKNCYKCIRHCPVKSIRFSGEQAHIIGEECILCGHCFNVCPQGAKYIKNDVEKAQVLIMQSSHVYASVAPSFVASFGCGIESMEKTLKLLGFCAAEETAVGATAVKKEYEKMLAEGGDNGREVIISSCCPTVNLLIQKYYPSLIGALAPVITPAQAHARMIKERDPEAKVVFIGPCISKKAEADMDPGFDDCVLTFEELREWINGKNLSVSEIPDAPENVDTGRARTFPTSGGILRCMDIPDNGYDCFAVDGIENCKAVLDCLKNGLPGKCFIEMSACSGSCIGGPVMGERRYSPVADRIAVDSYAGKEDFAAASPALDITRGSIQSDEPVPTEAEIKAILAKMGKTRPEQELNCGTCGYDTCREKATAIFRGKADLTMCLPYLKDKAESVSDSIIKNTPNGIIVLNPRLEVQRINAAARNILGIRCETDILGENVIRILDPAEFMAVQENGRNQFGKRMYLAEYDKYVEETILIDNDYEQIICILRDITPEESERSKKEKLSRTTMEVTDKIIDKQMRAVQEVASLLGETTAEMKVALVKLKESFKDE